MDDFKRYKDKIIECERLIDVEKDKLNKLYQENMELKHSLQLSKTKEMKTEIELIELLKSENVKNIKFFQDYKTDHHPVLEQMSLSSNIKSISELQDKIYELKISFANEQSYWMDKERLCNVLKEELRLAVENNAKIKVKFEQEREKLYLSKAQTYWHKEFTELFNDHIMKWSKSQDWCSYEYLKDLVSGGDDDHVNRIANELQIQNKDDAIEAIPRMFRERDSYWRDQIEANNKLKFILSYNYSELTLANSEIKLLIFLIPSTLSLNETGPFVNIIKPWSWYWYSTAFISTPIFASFNIYLNHWSLNGSFPVINNLVGGNTIFPFLTNISGGAIRGESKKSSSDLSWLSYDFIQKSKNAIFKIHSSKEFNIVGTKLILLRCNPGNIGTIPSGIEQLDKIARFVIPIIILPPAESPERIILS